MCSAHRKQGYPSNSSMMVAAAGSMKLRYDLPRIQLVLAVICLWAAAISSAAIPLVYAAPVVGGLTPSSKSNALCTTAIISAQSVNVCGIMGKQYITKSSTALLSAARFLEFDPAAPARSSDANTGGVVADYVLYKTFISDKGDVYKQLDATT